MRLCNKQLGQLAPADPWGGQVHGDLMSDAFVADRLLQQINPFHDAGIVDQYIEHGVKVANGVHERQHIRPRRDVALDRLDRRVFCLQLTKCHVIPPAGEDLGTLESEPDSELPTDPRRATRHHNGAVAPGTASRARVSSTGASLSSRRGLALAFGDNPVLEPSALCADQANVRRRLPRESGER